MTTAGKTARHTKSARNVRDIATGCNQDARRQETEETVCFLAHLRASDLSRPHTRPTCLAVMVSFNPHIGSSELPNTSTSVAQYH
jgi:hypothetical protein